MISGSPLASAPIAAILSAGALTGSVSFSGAGSFAADGEVISQAHVSFSGAGGFAAAGETTQYSAISFSGQGSFSAAGSFTILGAVAFAGEGIFAVDGSVSSFVRVGWLGHGYFYNPPYPNILVDAQAEIERGEALVPYGLSTTIRPDALTFDQLRAYTLGPAAIGDADSGILGWAWSVRTDGTTVWYARSNDAYDDWQAEQVLFTFSGDPIIELDCAFEQNGRIVVVAQRGTEIWLYWYKPSAADFVFEKFDDGRSPRVVLDNPNDTTIADVHIAYIKDGSGLLTRRQAELYATPHATVHTQWDGWYLEEFARNRGNRLVAILSRHTGVRYQLSNVESLLYPFYPVDEAVVTTKIVDGELIVTVIDHTLYDIGEGEVSALILNTSTLADVQITHELYDTEELDVAPLILDTSTLAVVVIVDDFNDLGEVDVAPLILNTSTLAIVVIEDILNDTGSVDLSPLILATSTLEVA